MYINYLITESDKGVPLTKRYKMNRAEEGLAKSRGKHIELSPIEIIFVFLI